jgi:hypothetical protein
MPAVSPDNPLPRPVVAARGATNLDACWPHVRVESAQISSGDVADCARAVIQLGGLTPADVRVELMPIEPEVPHAARPAEHRMFSSHAYDNGCFVFEASLPTDDTTQMHDWSIHVHPHEAVDEPRVEYRFRKPAP